jgi:hypothetical protein
MRNLKLKKVRPVATETETLHKNGDDLGLHLVGYSSQESSTSDLRAVKDTPGLHVMGDLYDVTCDNEFMVNADLLREHCLSSLKMLACLALVSFFINLAVMVVSLEWLCSLSHTCPYTRGQKKIM